MAISKVKLPDNSSQELHDYRISGVDSSPSSGSGNVVTSGGVYTALAGKQDVIQSVQVTVDNNTGTPSASGSVNGNALSLNFHNLKGAQGQKGEPGIDDVAVEVYDSTGTPSAVASISDGLLSIYFYGLKGNKGDSGYTGAADELAVINDLMTGGAANALSAEQGVVLNTRLTKTEKEIGAVPSSSSSLSLSWVVGSINQNTGANINSTTSIRSNFLTLGGDDHAIQVTCATGYFIKAILAYNSASLTDYSGILYYGYVNSAFNTEKDSVTIYPCGKVVRLVIGRTDLGTIAKAEGSNVTASDVYTGLNGKTLAEYVRYLQAEIDYNNVIRLPYESIDTTGNEYVDTSGSIANASSYRASDYITVSEGDVFTYLGYVGSSGIACAGYDSGKVFINALLSNGDYTHGTTITIPSGVSYVRFCGRVDIYPFEVRKAGAASATLRNVVAELAEREGAFSGRTILFIGDSITQGHVHSGTTPANPFPKLIGDVSGANVKNYGISGSTIAVADGNGGCFSSLAELQTAAKVAGEYYTVITGPQSYQVYYWDGNSLSESTRRLRTPISQRYEFMDDDADIVVVAAGSNDFQYNWTPVGSMSDRTTASFYGAIHVLCQGLLQKYLGKTVIFMTPIKRAQTSLDSSADTTAHQGGAYGSTDSVNLFGKTLGDYANIIKEVCEYYSIPVIDTYSGSLLNPSLASQSSLFDDVLTHPQQKGHNIMARYIYGQLKAIVGNYFE